MFCVYFTFYSGNKLPPFYIGSSSVSKVQNGYKGTVKSRAYKDVWKHEIKFHPEMFKTFILSTHDTRLSALSRERDIQEKLNVVRSPLYINMALASKNGFFGRDVRGNLNPNYGKKHTPHAKLKMKKPKTLTEQDRIKKAETLRQQNIQRLNRDPSLRETFRERMRGKNNPQYGKYGKEHPAYGRKHSLEAKNKISQSLLGKKKTTEHIKNRSILYKIQRESDGAIFLGYGLSDFSRAIGLQPSSFLYTLTSNKFRNGFKILEKIGKPTDECVSLVSFLTSPK